APRVRRSIRPTYPGCSASSQGKADRGEQNLGEYQLSPPQEWLPCPIGQTPPHPFERAEEEKPQPKPADDQLHDADGKENEVDLIELQFGKIVESITEEEERADDGLHDVIGKCHLPHGLEASEKGLGILRFVQQDERGDVSHDQKYPLEGID